MTAEKPSLLKKEWWVRLHPLAARFVPLLLLDASHVPDGEEAHEEVVAQELRVEADDDVIAEARPQDLTRALGAVLQVRIR